MVLSLNLMKNINMTHRELIDQVSEYARLEVPPKSEGKQIMMVLAPQINK